MMKLARNAVMAATIGAGLALGGCATEPSAGPATTKPAPGMVLAGQEMAITSINGKPVIPNSKVTIQFEDGRVFGAGSCNRFMGGYTMGDGLAIELSQMASTMMACPDALMTQEAMLLSTLADVTSYDVAGNVVTLRTSDGRTVVANRP